MDMLDSKDADARRDEATAARLAKLRSMPVDTSRLEETLRAKIPAAEVAGRPARRDGLRISSWFKPLPAVAASFVLLSAVVAVVLLSSSGGPALASASTMAQMHEDLVSGRSPVMQVSSIAEANQALAGQSPGGPMLPGAPEGHVMACCMKSVKGKRVACVLLRNGGEPITMTVANAADMRLPDSPSVTRAGVTYHVQAAGGLNMVMTERNGHWVCLIGRVPADRLMDLTSSLQF